MVVSERSVLVFYCPTAHPSSKMTIARRSRGLQLVAEKGIQATLVDCRDASELDASCRRLGEVVAKARAPRAQAYTKPARPGRGSSRVKVLSRIRASWGRPEAPTAECRRSRGAVRRGDDVSWQIAAVGGEGPGQNGPEYSLVACRPATVKVSFGRLPRRSLQKPRGPSAPVEALPTAPRSTPEKPRRARSAANSKGAIALKTPNTP